jgi:hypothetical protein
MKALILGPSGSGKTTLAKQWYPKGHLALDLDMLGYKLKSDKKSSGYEWIVEPKFVLPLLQQDRLIAAGIMDNWREIVKLPWDRVVVLYGEPELIGIRGTARDQFRAPRWRKTRDDYIASAIEWNVSTFQAMRNLIAPNKFVPITWDNDIKGVKARIISVLSERYKRSNRENIYESREKAVSNILK